MVYVALLRGINVGGKNRVEMARLKTIFEQLGFKSVKTYINSGNVIFDSDETDIQEMTDVICLQIEKDFGFKVPVVLRSLDQIVNTVHNIPDKWVNDDTMKCDVIFLWDEIDSVDILKQIPHKSEIEDVLYLPGAVVWRIDRSNVNRGQMLKIIGTDIYGKMTIRNANTLRKLYELMQAI